MNEQNTELTFQQRITDLVDDVMAGELDGLRTRLLPGLAREEIALMDFADSALRYLNQAIDVDRIFICHAKTGLVVAGWHKGRNVGKESDWDPGYIPLDMDLTLRAALEGDEMIANPVPGIGADLVVPLRFAGKGLWLMVLDHTESARAFSAREMAHIRLVRDVIVAKVKLFGGVESAEP